MTQIFMNNSVSSVQSVAKTAALFLIWLEDLLYRALEKSGNFEGEWQTGVVFAGFNRVDRLARNIKPFGKLGLRPLALGA